MKIFTAQDLRQDSPALTLQGPAVLMACPEDSPGLLDRIGIDGAGDFPKAEKQATHYEARDSYDYLSLFLPDFARPDQDPDRIDCYLNPSFLLVIGACPFLEKFEQDLALGLRLPTSPAQALAQLFNRLLEDGTDLLESIDDRIEDLEEEARGKDPRDQLSALLPLRKQVQALKRYYQALFEVFEEMDDNRNQHFSHQELKVFRAQKNKVNRILNMVLNLRDQLTQAREALQNQVDISLNETMRFFTVITAVFLPPTLLVGWYGMNLPMPELNYALTYPLVAVASFAFIVLSLIFCKKKGWF